MNKHNILNFDHVTILMREANKPVVFRLGRFSRSLASMCHLSKVDLSVNTVVLKVSPSPTSQKEGVAVTHPEPCYLPAWYVKTSRVANKGIIGNIFKKMNDSEREILFQSRWFLFLLSTKLKEFLVGT